MANKILRPLYRNFPFKKQLFQIVKKIGVPPFYKKLSFNDVFQIKINEHTSFRMQADYGIFIENELFWKGLSTDWEKISLETWIKLSKHSKTILDIGANTGVYSLIAEAINKDATIYSFEPIQRNVDMLKRNRALNNFNFNIVEEAVSDYDGFCTMYQLPGQANYMTSVNKNRYDKDQEVIETKVPTEKLASFIEKNGIKKIDLVKLDVEEHELEVINGFGHFLAEMKPAILIEIIDNEKARQIQQIFDTIGYHYYYIDEINPPKRVDKLLDNDHHNYLICMPETAKQIGL